MNDRKWTVVAVVVLIVIAVAASGAAMAFLLGSARDELVGDEVPYVGIARSLVSGEGYSRHGVPTTTRAPGMVLYLVLPHIFGEPSVLLLRWYAMLPTILLSLVAFAIWRRIGFAVGRSFVLALPFAPIGPQGQGSMPAALFRLHPSAVQAFSQDDGRS